MASLRAAGTSYMDLAIKLRRPQYTDGYETVSRYQRLAVACAKHGRVLTAGIWQTMAGSHAPAQALLLTQPTAR